MNSTRYHRSKPDRPPYRGALNSPFVQQLSSTDRDVLRFADTWLVFGGGSEEDMMVQFGLDTRRYVSRLAEILHRDAELQMGAEFHRECRSVYRINHCGAD